MLTPEETARLQHLLATHRKTLSIYVEQQAKLGSTYAPPGVQNGIDEAREEIRRIKTLLRDANVEVTDYLNDELNSDLTEYTPIRKRRIPKSIDQGWATLAAATIILSSGILFFLIQTHGLSPSDITPTSQNSGGSTQTSTSMILTKVAITTTHPVPTASENGGYPIPITDTTINYPPPNAEPTNPINASQTNIAGEVVSTITSVPTIIPNITIAQNQLASVISTMNLYLQPGSKNFPVRQGIQPGTIVQVLNIENDWAYIRIRQRAFVEVGWVPLDALDLTVVATPTSVPPEDSVQLSIKNPNEQNILIIIEGPEIGEIEIEVGAGKIATIHLPAGSYNYHVYKEYVSNGAPPTPTPSPEPNLCATYQGQLILSSGEKQVLEILPLTKEQGEPFFASCPQTTATPH
jgi:hypothetical protein